ncbi:hypothetical protein VTK56DRAFT_7630 [Thermocarpiscus australiensis]
MEALKNLINNVPDWLKRLDELNGQIEQRQIELAQLTEAAKSSLPEGSPSGVAKSIRNKGSTESLRPRDEPETHPRDPTAPPEHTEADHAAAGAAAAKANTNTEQQPTPSCPADAQSPSALQRLTNQVRAAGQARARATLRKRQRTDSMISAEGGGGPATCKYRSRCMIIVYYDSYVQLFFEELVKFVSASRNMMRKAKMAAKVAQIKRLAELEVPDDDGEDEGGNQEGTDGLLAAQAAPAPQEEEQHQQGPLSLPYVSTRMGGGLQGPLLSRTSRPVMLMGMRGAGARVSHRGPSSSSPSAKLGPDGLPADKADVYDELDKGLEYVQSMCEHAAHQFLRDGDCAEEVDNIKRRLRETKELADAEMARVEREEPEALRTLDDEIRGRSYRPHIMRKANAAAHAKEPAPEAKTPEVKHEVVKPAPPALEVDEGIEDMDDEALPKLVYKSTRMMR